MDIYLEHWDLESDSPLDTKISKQTGDKRPWCMLRGLVVMSEDPIDGGSNPDPRHNTKKLLKRTRARY